MKRVLRSQADYRSTLLRNQLTSLVLFEAITTTRAKAKQLISFVDAFFNSVKPADLNAKKLAHRTLFDELAVKKVFEELLPRYAENETTFVRAYRVMPRKGDAAAMMMVSFIRPLVVKEKTAEKAEKPKAKKVTKK